MKIIKNRLIIGQTITGMNLKTSSGLFLGVTSGEYNLEIPVQFVIVIPACVGQEFDLQFFLPFV